MAEKCPSGLSKIYGQFWPEREPKDWDTWYSTCYRTPLDDIHPCAESLFESFEEPNYRIFEKKVALAFRKPPFLIEDMQVNLRGKDGGIDCASPGSRMIVQVKTKAAANLTKKTMQGIVADFKEFGQWVTFQMVIVTDHTFAKPALQYAETEIQGIACFMMSHDGELVSANGAAQAMKREAIESINERGFRQLKEMNKTHIDKFVESIQLTAAASAAAAVAADKEVGRPLGLEEWTAD